MPARFKTLTTELRIRKTGSITADDIRKKFNIPAHADIFITIPSGGDYSGMDLKLGEDIPLLKVDWEDVK